MVNFARAAQAPATLLLASWGWGWLAKHFLQRLTRPRPAHLTISVGQTMALGLSIYLAVIGVFLAFDRANAGLINVFSLVGLAISVIAIVRALPSLRRRLGMRPVVLVFVVLVLGIGQLAFARYLPGLNPCDDYPAYAYLARRLLQTGDLLDSFNLRRLVSPGGSTAIHAWVLQSAPESFLFAIDFVVGGLLILLLLAGHGKARPIVATCIVLPVLVSPTIAGLLINTSLRLVATSLVLATFQHLVSIWDMKSPDSATGRSAIVAFGLVALLVIRPTFAVAPALVAIIVLLRRWRAGDFQSAAITAAVSFVALIGWSVASWRSSGTPLFPLISGNYDSSFPGSGSPSGFDAQLLIEKNWELLMAGAFGIALLVLLVTLRALVPRTSPQLGVRAVFAMAVGAGLIATMLVVAAFLGSSNSHIQRFTSPVLLGIALFGIWAVMSSISNDYNTEAEWPTKVPSRRWHSTLAMLLCVALTLLMSGLRLEGLGAGLVGRWRLSRALMNDGTLFADPYRDVRGEYRRAQAFIPAGADVLAAVDYPGLLDARRMRLSTLDQAGSVSPPPHMPFFIGREAKLKYLRDVGIDFLVATDSAASTCLYNDGAWRANLTQDEGVFQQWTPYVLEWNEFVRGLAASGLPKERIASLWIFDIRKDLG